MRKSASYILSIIFCLLACQTQARSLVRRALTSVNPLKLTKPLARPVNWLTQTQFYKRHPWLVKTGAVIATGMIAKYLHTQYKQYRFSQAVKQGNLAKIRYYIRKGVKVNTLSDWDEETPLKNAVVRGHSNIVKELIAAGADVNLTTDDMTPLYLAAEDNAMEIVRELVINGAELPSETALDELENRNFNPVRIRRAIEEALAYRAKEGFIAAQQSPCKPMHIVAEYLFGPSKQTLRSTQDQVLHEHSIDVKGEDDFTVLMCAADEGHLNIVKKLIELGTDVNAQNKNKCTALMYAAAAGHLEIVRILIQAKADIDTESDSGDTALTYAASASCDVVQELIKAGAQVNHRNKKNSTALMHAAHYKYFDTVRVLALHGAELTPDDFSRIHLSIDDKHAMLGVLAEARAS